MNNLAISTSENEFDKKLFSLKNEQRDGLVLNIHLKNERSLKIRFVHAHFNKTGEKLVIGSNEGNISIIHFIRINFWTLPYIYSLVIIKCSPHDENEIIIGNRNGNIQIVDIESGEICHEFIGHKLPVKQLDFSKNNLLVSSSSSEAIIWNLKTKSIVQVFCLEKGCVLKQVLFVPLTNDILTCYDDDSIQIWKFGIFENIITLYPENWSNFTIKSITFSNNGKFMVLSGRSPQLAIFSLNIWKLSTFIKLPEYIQTVKSANFIPESNTILSVLTGHGRIYFFDLERSIMLSELNTKCEIVDCDCSIKQNYVACVLCLGDIQVYNLSKYIEPPQKMKICNGEKIIGEPRKIKLRTCSKDLAKIKEQIRNMLNIDKLRLILKEYNHYPNLYRTKIWEELLKIPNNKDQFEAIIDHTSIKAFDDLHKNYPLENKRNLQNLKKLLINLSNWCPFFSFVNYLPLFVFPFVKVFINKPIACFEIVCTILLNWCQLWFEYYPLPPLNILAMLENILLEHDPELLDHFTKNQITSELYAWTILKTAFTEVLTVPKWFIFWDHVLTNETSFLLCAVAAYNILQRSNLLSFQSLDKFEFFFEHQNPIQVEKLIKKSYYILTNTSERVHPRQYFSEFKPLEIGQYSSFTNYPHIMDYEKELGRLQKKKEIIQSYRDKLSKRQNEDEAKLEEMAMLEEENRRLFEMKKAVRQKLLNEQQEIKELHDDLLNLRKQLNEDEYQLLDHCKIKTANNKIKNQQRDLDSFIDNVQLSTREFENEIKNFENQLLTKQSEDIRSEVKKEVASNRIQFVRHAHRKTLNNIDDLKDEIKRLTSDVEKLNKVLKHLKKQESN